MTSKGGKSLRKRFFWSASSYFNIWWDVYEIRVSSVDIMGTMMAFWWSWYHFCVIPDFKIISGFHCGNVSESPSKIPKCMMSLSLVFYGVSWLAQSNLLLSWVHKCRLSHRNPPQSTKVSKNPKFLSKLQHFTVAALKRNTERRNESPEATPDRRRGEQSILYMILRYKSVASKMFAGFPRKQMPIYLPHLLLSGLECTNCYSL